MKLRPGSPIPFVTGFLTQAPPCIHNRNNLYVTDLCYQRRLWTVMSRDLTAGHLKQVPHLTCQSILHPYHGWIASSQSKSFMILIFFHNNWNLKVFAWKAAEQNKYFSVLHQEKYVLPLDHVHTLSQKNPKTTATYSTRTTLLLLYVLY